MSAVLAAEWVGEKPIISVDYTNLKTFEIDLDAKPEMRFDKVSREYGPQVIDVFLTFQS